MVIIFINYYSIGIILQAARTRTATASSGISLVKGDSSPSIGNKQHHKVTDRPEIVAASLNDPGLFAGAFIADNQEA